MALPRHCAIHDEELYEIRAAGLTLDIEAPSIVGLVIGPVLAAVVGFAAALAWAWLVW